MYDYPRKCFFYTNIVKDKVFKNIDPKNRHYRYIYGAFGGFRQNKTLNLGK